MGIIVITDAFTKFPYAKPIRSKTAEEIAERLKEYICLFGCMKILLTDFGKSFNNKVLDAMMTNKGVEHKSTTSFNPRCNGLTERLNRSLITALRKHAESNHLTWPAWLDWVLLAYRTRVHSSTGYCPFSLTFGEKANTFKDWRSEPDKNSELELVARTSEIQNLFEKTTLSALAPGT